VTVEERSNVAANPVGRGLDREHLAATAAFFTHGFVLGAWAPRIPDVRHALGLDDARLGLALLGAPLGTLLGQLLGATLVRRVGSRPLSRAALVGACVTPVLLPLAADGPELFATLTLWGGFMGVLDLAMNASAVETEQARDRRIMVGLHGRWSIGALVGSGVGAAAAATGITVLVQEAVSGAVVLAVAWWLTRPLLDHRVPGAGRLRLRRPSRLLVLLAVLSAADFLCEGSVSDWSAVYLRDSVGAAAGVAGLGYSVYLVAMIAGRLTGDRLRGRWGAVRPVRLFAAAATVAMVAALVAGGVVAALIGFAVLGVGLACVVPIAFAAAARGSGARIGQRLAVVTTAGYSAYMAGPPLIGGLASVLSLPAALGVLPVLTLVIVLAAGVLRAADGPAAPNA
jgi:MFS family permease